MPHSIEAEQALLGALLLTNEVADKITGLESHHFYDQVHGRIYALTMRLIGEGRIASPISLKPHLQTDPGLSELGGVPYLMTLVGAAIDTTTAREYACVIRDLWARRTICEAAEEMQVRAGSDHESGVDDVLDYVDHALGELRAGVGDARLYQRYFDILESAMNWANEAYQREGRPYISTGLSRIDSLIGGLQRGRLYLLQGTSSMGKSALGIAIGDALIAQGFGVLFPSFEMPGEEIAHRRTSAYLAGRGIVLPHFNIARGQMDEAQMRAYIEASRDTASQPFLIAEDDCIKLPRLRAAVWRAHKDLSRTATPLGAVILDYLQLVQVPGAKDRVTEVGIVVREIKQWAKELDIPIIALAQSKPDVEDRKNKRPGKRDVQWASEAHQAADVVAAVYRHDYYLTQQIAETDDERERSKLIQERADCAGMVEAIVSKHRGGPIGTAIFWSDLPTNRFSDERFASASAGIRAIDQHEFAV